MQILVATLRGAEHQQQRAAAYAALLPSLIRPTVVLAGRTKLRVSKNFFREDIFLYLLNIFATAVPKLKQKISKIIVQF